MKYLDKYEFNTVKSTLKYLADAVAMTDVQDLGKDPDVEVIRCLKLLERARSGANPWIYVAVGFFAGTTWTMAGLFLWAAFT